MTHMKHAFRRTVCCFTVLFSSTVITSNALAEPFMTKAQYEDYSVRYQCAQLKYHDDLAKKEELVMELEAQFGINDDTFDAFDALIPEFEKDDDLLNSVRERVQKECI